jgi:hypothetical protein
VGSVRCYPAGTSLRHQLGIRQPSDRLNQGPMAHVQPHSPRRRPAPGGEPLNSTFSSAHSLPSGLHNQAHLIQTQTQTQQVRSPPAQPNPNSSQSAATMMGPGVSWNPDPTGLPLYPPEETLAAEYQAFLESYQRTVGGAAPPNSLGYPLEGNDAQRDESRNSTSSVSYSTAGSHANYASPDPYPPSNSTSHPQGFINSLDRNQHNQEAPDRQSMQSLSPESFASAESPHAAHAHHYQYQQHYFPQDAQPFYPNQWIDNSVQNPQIAPEYPSQHTGGQTPARHPRPPASTPFAPSYGSTYPQYTQPQSMGVAPSQVSARGTQGTSTNVAPQMRYVVIYVGRENRSQFNPLQFIYARPKYHGDAKLSSEATQPRCQHFSIDQSITWSIQ